MSQDGHSREGEFLAVLQPPVLPMAEELGVQGYFSSQTIATPRVTKCPSPGFLGNLLNLSHFLAKVKVFATKPAEILAWFLTHSWHGEATVEAGQV